MFRFLLLLALPLLWWQPVDAQINLISITNDCNTFNFCATVPPNTDAIDWRRNGVTQPRQFGTNCISLPGPFETIQAFFLTAVVTPFGTFFQPNGNTAVINRPPIPNFNIFGGSGYQPVCSNGFYSIPLSVASCIPNANWTVTGIQTLFQATPGGVAINANVAGVSSGITSTGRLTITANGNWRPNCAYSIGLRVQDELGTVRTRTYIAYTTTSCFFFREADDDELSLLENAERDAEGRLSPAARAELAAVTAELARAAEPLAADDPLSVFPNPASSQVTVRHARTPETLRVVDLTGRPVYQATTGQFGEQYTRLDVSQLPTGLYLVEATFADGDRQVSKLQINQ